MANFPIGPGRKTQVLRVRDNLTTPEHFYIHVSGSPQDSAGVDFFPKDLQNIDILVFSQLQW